jgi:hypothetical protein
MGNREIILVAENSAVDTATDAVGETGGTDCLSTNARKEPYTYIMTVTVEVIHDGVFNLLSDMERLNLIRVNTPAKNAAGSGEKLSSRFAGALKLSNTKYEEYQNALKEGRNEWTRDIC